MSWSPCIDPSNHSSPFHVPPRSDGEHDAPFSPRDKGTLEAEQKGRGVREVRG